MTYTTNKKEIRSVKVKIYKKSKVNNDNTGKNKNILHNCIQNSTRHVYIYITQKHRRR